MNDINQAARVRQRARLAEGEKPPAPRAALALAKSKTYQSAADAPETLRAYKATLCIAAYGFLISERGAIPPSGPNRASVIEEPALPDSYRPRGSPDPT